MATKIRNLEEKLSILKSAEEADNVSDLCRRLGFPRSSLYALRKAYAQNGAEGLQPKPRRKPRMPNTFSEAVVANIVEMTRRFPSYSGQRISLKLKTIGVKASASGIRKVWKRHGLKQGDL